MRTWLARIAYLGCRFAKMSAAITALLSVCAAGALAQPASEAGGEASLKLPDLSSVEFLGVDGHKLLLIGIIFCVLGLLFGFPLRRGEIDVVRGIVHLPLKSGRRFESANQGSRAAAQLAQLVADGIRRGSIHKWPPLPLAHPPRSAAPAADPSTAVSVRLPTS